MEKLRGLRRSSVVSAGVYSPDCEANGEREQSAGEMFISSAWETEESSFSMLLLMWSHANPSGILWDIILRDAEEKAEGMRIPELAPQKDKEKAGAYLSVEL